MSNSPIRTQFISLILVTSAFATQANGQCQWEWGPGSGLPGVDSLVLASAVFDDGTGPALYVGGYFGVAGDVVANYVAKWDGQRWSSLGSGVNDIVYALAVYDDGSGPALYAGGEFTIADGISAKGIAKWDGTNWSALGTGIIGNNPIVMALTVYDDGTGPALYAGGTFGAAGGLMAKWKGSNWTSVGGGLGSNNGDFVWVLMTVDQPGGGQTLYAGGRFSIFSSANIAKWNGSGWLPVGSGMSFDVYSLAAFDDGGGPAVYAGGKFTTAGGVSVGNIAKWNGSNWSALGSGMNSVVYALRVFDDGSGPALFAGGFFTSAGGIEANHMAKWDGASWSALGLGVNGDGPTTLTIFDDGEGAALYAAGNFTVAGGVGTARVARWDGTNWSSTESGTNGSVEALAVFNDGGRPAIYAGGAFTTVGGVSANYVAKFDGAEWSGLGSGTNNSVEAMTVFDDGGGPALYMGGPFSSAGGVSANHIAKWDGENWSPLGVGMDGPSWLSVTALTVFDDGMGPALYAGGTFTTAGGAIVNYIAKWDGATWSSLDSGMDNNVYALAVFDDGTGSALYAGGWFHTAGGVTAHRIAKWNGTNWSALGSGILNSSVSALTVFDDGGGPALYVGGSFNEAGGISANNIAKWNGTDWSGMGSGFDHSVNELVVLDDGSGSALYASGVFSFSGTVRTNHVARWNGASWSPLGSGMDRNVYSAMSFDDGWGPTLYAGGDFTTAGLRTSTSFAKWSCRLDTPRTISFNPSGQPAASNSAIRVRLDSLHHAEPPYSGGPSVPFTSFEGEVRWVGPPSQYVESTASGTPFTAAQLQCTPHYQDWSTVGLLSVFGSALVPSSSYRIEMLASSCQGIETHCRDVSSPLIAITRRWADVETPYNPPVTSVLPDLGDVAALVNKFKSIPGAPIKARALLAGDDSFGNISPSTLSLDLGFGHIAACVDAFKGKPYPHTIQACP